MNGLKACDIIIPVYNKEDLTSNCLKSIEAKTHTPYRLILIDNASGPLTMKFLEEYKITHPDSLLVRNDENLGWVKAVNQGIELSRAPYICVMNNDTIIETDDWLKRMIEVADSEEDIGLVNPDFADKLRHPPLTKPYIEVDFCRGYCVLIKRSVVEKIGGFDEAYGFGYYDDDDFSVRAIRAGFRCVKVRDVTVRHLRDSTFASLFKDDKRIALHEKNKELFYSRWGRRLKLVFIVTSDKADSKIAKLVLDLARKQHVVYLWNTAKSLFIEHINVRERFFPPIFSAVIFSTILFFNKMKNEDKRYTGIFVDDRDMARVLSKMFKSIHYFDAEKDTHSVIKTIDAAAGVKA
ncbi:MAG: glycosyltransferase family 2 protein [Candidatus Omnitrophica bacterium]|nr:glycosyltransferase family 2 protein [Candidatus Omnitrophota bacterium]MCM8790566.1 glycosyltransferase family 2 protein [Candidatus Omnitrophota bacterium]